MNRCAVPIAFFGVVCFVCIPYVASAHIVPYMAIKTVLNVEDHSVRFKTEFGSATTIKNTESIDLDTQRERLRAYYEDYFALLYGESPASAQSCTLALLDEYRVNLETETTTIAGVYACPEVLKKIEKMYVVTDAFSDAFVKYDHYISIHLGTRRKDFILNQWVLTNFPISEEVVAALFPPPEPGTINLARFEQPKIGEPQNALIYVLKRFLRMGVEHILSGIDHILFLLSTIILLTSVRRMLVLVSAFTIAHSITLILAGLGIITLPSAVVEPLIAASIIFVVLWSTRSLWRDVPGETMRARWIMAFGFGLVHGLGFAGALVDIDIPRQYFVPAILLFNVGVELGQLMILAAIVPLLILLYRKYHAYRRRVLLVCTAIIGLFALFWFLERLGIFEILLKI